MEALEQMYSYSWNGEVKSYLDQVDLSSYQHMWIGRFGGSILHGAHKNENACLILTGPDWELAVIMGAQHTVESAAFIADSLMLRQRKIIETLDEDTSSAMKKIDSFLMSMFNSVRFRSTAAKVNGNSSCLISVRKAGYLYWLSIGDNALFLLPPSEAHTSSVQMNQQHRSGWIGADNTFDQEVPAYNMGIIPLSKGRNSILLTTSGLQRFPVSPYKNPSRVQRAFTKSESVPRFLHRLLTNAQSAGAVESITLIGWEIHI
ncbi:hypothetical protein SAMN05421503_2596 [Terribacillus aidingensis]|uniref:Serine/threonine protein phosphatase PrpC n=1 Tax=Terribacillus aidingensis TaxID=586416 RepID=A0A285P5Y7_9BACI|nr:protein phosphatase 2C domain-containing protein [Terribacillus aidingensis]SNZ15291.1 hypothetical protein SAMN05421503_2596 [Terribacillus aidingensis]